MEPVYSDGTLDPNYQYWCKAPSVHGRLFDTITECGQHYVGEVFGTNIALGIKSCAYTWTAVCDFQFNGYVSGYVVADRTTRVDPMPQGEEKTIPLSTIAQKIISNASSSNQAISLLAEAYLENMAQSIFSTDESKQFVKLSDLTSQFELNKILAN